MIKSAILHLYNGERGSCGSVELSNEYGRLLRLAIDAEKKFQETLESQYPELTEAFENILAANDDARALECDDYYAEGFRFGALIALDVVGFSNTKK